MPRSLRLQIVRLLRALPFLALAAGAGCASLRGGSEETPPAAAADPCRDPRYLTLKERGPQGLSPEDSVFVVRTSLECTYGARARGKVMVGRAPVDTVRPQAAPAPPPDRAKEATAWTVTGLMLWVLAHAAGIL